LERFERAEKLGLNPDPEVNHINISHSQLLSILDIDLATDDELGNFE